MHDLTIDMKRVLVVSAYSCGRAPMAAAYINEMADGRITAECAGLRPRDLDPLVVAVMQEDGMNLSGTPSRDLGDLLGIRQGYDYVVSVGDKPWALQCPAVSGIPRQLFWPFPDYRNFSGTRPEKLEKIRSLRDQIKAYTTRWIAAVAGGSRPNDKVVPLQRRSAGRQEKRLFTVV